MKTKGIKLNFLKICGCSCTHCTHAIQVPEISKYIRSEIVSQPTVYIVIKYHKGRAKHYDDSKQPTVYVYRTRTESSGVPLNNQ